MTGVARRLVLACVLASAAANGPAGAAPATPEPGRDPVAAPAGAPIAVPLDRFPALAKVRAQQVGGVMVLDGEVSSEADRELATKLAATQPGVDEVVDRMDVSLGLDDRLGQWRASGGTRLSRLLAATPLLAVAAAIVWLAWWLGRLLSRSRWGPLGGQSGNPFLASLARQAVQLGSTLAGLLVALQLLDALTLAGALVGSAGIVGITLGFAFRDLAENYIASILLSLRQPFAPDDSVVIDGHEGFVVGLNSRATLLMTPDGNHLRLPNALVFKAVILNHTRNAERRFSFDMRLAPDADADVALAAGLEALQQVPGVLPEPAPFAQIADADQEWLRMQYFGWTDQRTSNFGWVRSEAIRRVRQALSCAGLAMARPPVQVLDSPAGKASLQAETISPTAAPRSETQAVQEAVTRARAEMADDDLMSPGARRE